MTSLANRSGKSTVYDKITAYYLEGKTLTATQNETRLRWEEAYAMLRDDINTPGQAAKKLMHLHECSQAQAYRYVSNALRLFGNIRLANKEGLRVLLLEYQLKLISEAMSSKNYKEANRGIANAIKIAGLDRDDNQAIDLTDLQPHTFMVAFDPSTLGFDELEDVESLLAKVKKRKVRSIDNIQNAEVIEDED